MNKEQRSKTFFLNGREVTLFELSGDEAKDLAAAKRLLAEQDIADAQRESTPPADATQDRRSSLCGSTL